jgi:ribose-phosphate pyrophosphokinase
LVRVHDDVAGKHVVVCATTASSESWLELFFLIDALARGGAVVSLLFAYSGYGRQDRLILGQSSGMSVLYGFLQTFSLKKITVVHAHNAYAWDASNLHHVLPLTFFSEHVRDSDIIVAPDSGAQGLATALAAEQQKECVLIHKVRLAHDRVQILEVPEIDLRSKRCVIVDDMIATGSTVVAVADALRARGAQHVSAVATHGLFVGNAYKNIQDSSLTQVIVTNTIHHETRNSRVSVIDIGACVRQLITDIFTQG